MAGTDLLVLSVLGRESVCRFVWSEVVTPIVAPPRAIWLPVNMESSDQTALPRFQKLSCERVPCLQLKSPRYNKEHTSIAEWLDEDAASQQHLLNQNFPWFLPDCFFSLQFFLKPKFTCILFDSFSHRFWEPFKSASAWCAVYLQVNTHLHT